MPGHLRDERAFGARRDRALRWHHELQVLEFNGLHAHERRRHFGPNLCDFPVFNCDHDFFAAHQHHDISTQRAEEQDEDGKEDFFSIHVFLL